MLKKGTRLYSILKFRCPRCHEGKFFKANPYQLRQAGEIHKKCEACGLKYSKEPGFYYGAMYVSYALGVALFVTLWVLLSLTSPQLTTAWQIGIIVAATLLLTPLFYALSKIIWANLFIKFVDEK